MGFHGEGYGSRVGVRVPGLGRVPLRDCMSSSSAGGTWLGLGLGLGLGLWLRLRVTVRVRQLALTLTPARRHCEEG